MITESEIQILKQDFPALDLSNNSLSGSLTFRAVYNSEFNWFKRYALDEDINQNGLYLSGTFTIRIEPRKPGELLQLPKLTVNDIIPHANRHFYANGSACLCSPIEEDDFLQPESDFMQYFDGLVIPFLYAQRYYDLNNRQWPWHAYSHDIPGILESYEIKGSKIKTLDSLLIIRDLTNLPQWYTLKRWLCSKSELPMNALCFCENQSIMVQCHSKAFKGLRKLKRDFQELKLDFPQPCCIRPDKIDTK